MSSWFAVSEVEPGVFLVAEPGHVNCFLIVGTERAVLFDTGMGIADIRSVCETLTALPILAVNSHGHYDHRGGNVLFDRVACHPLAGIVSDVPVDFLRRYAAVTASMLADLAAYQALDERWFHALTAASTPRALPAGFDAATWRVPGRSPDLLLADGDEIDLGDRSLRVLHTPGHAPDSLCLWDAARGSLYAGDTLIAGDFWVHGADADVGVFAATLAGVAALEPRVAYPAHTLRSAVDASFVRAAAAGMAAVAAGGSAGVPGVDMFGSAVTRHRFGDFAVLMPAP